MFILLQLLVLGGNGFVGSHVCREALERGISVSSLSRYCYVENRTCEEPNIYHFLTALVL